MAEAYSPLHTALKYYGKVENGVITKYGAQIPFNFELIQYTSMGTETHGFIKNILNWILNLPNGEKIHANWLVSSIINNNLKSFSFKKKIHFNIVFISFVFS